jgi:hypothetical protein
MREPDALDAADTKRLMAAWNVFMSRESVSFCLYKVGLMPEKLRHVRAGALGGILNRPGPQWFVDAGGPSLSTDFPDFR